MIFNLGPKGIFILYVHIQLIYEKEKRILLCKIYRSKEIYEFNHSPLSNISFERVSMCEIIFQMGQH